MLLSLLKPSIVVSVVHVNLVLRQIVSVVTAHFI